MTVLVILGAWVGAIFAALALASLYGTAVRRRADRWRARHAQPAVVIELDLSRARRRQVARRHRGATR